MGDEGMAVKGERSNVEENEEEVAEIFSLNLVGATFAVAGEAGDSVEAGESVEPGDRSVVALAAARFSRLLRRLGPAFRRRPLLSASLGGVQEPRFTDVFTIKSPFSQESTNLAHCPFFH